MSDPVDKLRDLIGTIYKQEAENKRLQAVVDAAREVAKRWDIRGLGNPLPGEHPTDADCLNAMSDALRALDGEVKP